MQLHKRLISFFLNGLLYTVPIAVLAYIIYQLFVFLDSLLPFDAFFPGQNLLLLLVIITLIGFFGSTFIGRPIRRYFNDLLERIPLLKTIYTSITKLMSAFVGQKKRFDKPVMVKLTKDSNLSKLGFVTDKDLLILGDQKGSVAVYLPHSFNFSGNLFIVPTEHITAIDQSGADVMKYIVSGGIADVEEEQDDD